MKTKFLEYIKESAEPVFMTLQRGQKGDVEVGWDFNFGTGQHGVRCFHIIVLITMFRFYQVIKERKKVFRFFVYGVKLPERSFQFYNSKYVHHTLQRLGSNLNSTGN